MTNVIKKRHIGEITKTNYDLIRDQQLMTKWPRKHVDQMAKKTYEIKTLNSRKPID